jgi:hypothetical protein
MTSYKSIKTDVMNAGAKWDDSKVRGRWYVAWPGVRWATRATAAVTRRESSKGRPEPKGAEGGFSARLDIGFA